jgi:hypothetical protein
VLTSGSISASSAAAGLLVVGPDAGGQPRVKVYDAATRQLKFNFLAYPSPFHGGVRVAVGDVTGDLTPDIITAQGPGGGNLIRVFNGLNGSLVGGFQAFPGNTAVFVAAGDVNGDGGAEIIAGTDQGSEPLVNVFSGTTGGLLFTVAPEGLSPTGGARVASGDVNADGRADLIVAGGPGGIPRIGVIDGATRAELYNYLAADYSFRGDLYVAAGDVTGDGYADIITGAGSGPSDVRIFSGADSTSLARFLAYDASFPGGARVGIADVNNDGWAEIITAQGPGGGQVRAFDARTVSPLASVWPYGQQFQDGAFVAGTMPPPPIQSLSGSSVYVHVRL